MAKSFNALMATRFTKITNDYGKVNDYVHETAMLIVNHAKDCGDCSTAQKLVMALPASMRREMLILWFHTFTPIVVKNDDKWNAKMHKEGTKLFVNWDIEAANATPFFRLAEQNKEAAPLTFEQMVKMVEGLAKRIEKKIENGEVEQADVPSAHAIAAKIAGLKLTRVKPSNDDSNEEEAERAA